MAGLEQELLDLKARVTKCEEQGFGRQAENTATSQTMKMLTAEQSALKAIVEQLNISHKDMIDKLNLAAQIVQTGSSRFDQLEGAATQHAGRLDTLLASVTDIQTRVAAVESSGSQSGQGSSGLANSSTKKVDLLNLRSLSNVPSYGGKPEDYEAWARAVRNFLSYNEERFIAILFWIESQTDKFTEGQYVRDLSSQGLSDQSALRHLTEQLWYIISAKTSGSVCHLLRKLEDEKPAVRGALAWHSIHAHVMGMNSRRLQTLLDRVQHPERCENIDKLEEAISCWEADLRDFERASGQSVLELTKKGALLRLVPKRIADQLEVQAQLEDYDDCRDYVETQIVNGRSAWKRATATPKPSADVQSGAKMDLSACQSGQNHIYDEQVSGHDYGDCGSSEDMAGLNVMPRTGGNPNANIQCDHCGRWGHKWRQCWDLSESPGKGGFKGGSAPKGGFVPKGASKGDSGGKGGNPKGFQPKGGYGKSGPKGAEYTKGYTKGASRYFSSPYQYGKGGYKGGYAGAFEQYPDFADTQPAPGAFCSVMTDTMPNANLRPGTPAFIAVKEVPESTPRIARTYPTARSSEASGIEIRNRWEVLSNASEEDDMDIPSAAVLDRALWPKPTAAPSKPSQKRTKAISAPRGRRWSPLGSATSQFPVASPGAENHKPSPIPSALAAVGFVGNPGVLGDPRAVQTTVAGTQYLGALVSRKAVEDADGMGRLDSEQEPNFVGFLQGDQSCSVNNLHSEEWEVFESLMDSGASNSVTMPETGVGVPLEPSEGSRAGQVYLSANGTKMPNRGEKKFEVQTEEGMDFTMLYQCADVVKPLTSVSQICDAGSGRNFVVFTATGGYVWHADQGTYTSFARKDDLYKLRTWIKRPSEPDSHVAGEPQRFHRQGR